MDTDMKAYEQFTKESGTDETEMRIYSAVCIVRHPQHVTYHSELECHPKHKSSMLCVLSVLGIVTMYC